MEVFNDFDIINLDKEMYMKIKFTEKKYKISDKLKQIITSKLSKLEKYFDEDVSATVVCSEQNKIQKLEITVLGKGAMYRSEVSSGNMYDNIDLALPKLERQVVRVGQKRVDRRKRAPVNLGFEFIEELPEKKLPGIYRRKSVDLEPITVEEAKDAIERLDHSFFIFYNKDTDKINVLYRRNEAGYGLIEVNY